MTHESYLIGSDSLIALIGILGAVVSPGLPAGSRTCSGVEVVRQSYEVVAEYPHDPGAFTQGLTFGGGYLHESTGRFGESSLRQVEVETGVVVRKLDLPDHLFGEGIALVEDRIYQLTWLAKRGFVYERSTLEPVGEFRYETEGWGLTFDGENLVLSDGSAVLHLLDPGSFDVVGHMTVMEDGVPVTRINELEFVEGEIYANIWHSDEVLRISPETGCVVGRIDLSGLIDPALLTDPEAVLNGIAYDEVGRRLFVTGKLWPKLFEIRVTARERRTPVP